jgi:putative transposase
MLRAEGRAVSRKRVQRLMRKMGIVALGPKPRTTKPAPGHKIFLYLLRSSGRTRSSARTSPISASARLPLSGGVHGPGESDGLAWRLSNTMDTSFCISALAEALVRFGRPEIFKTLHLRRRQPVVLLAPTIGRRLRNSALRHISPMTVPSSACRKMKAINFRSLHRPSPSNSPETLRR